MSIGASDLLVKESFRMDLRTLFKSSLFQTVPVLDKFNKTINNPSSYLCRSVVYMSPTLLIECNSDLLNRIQASVWEDTGGRLVFLEIDKKKFVLGDGGTCQQRQHTVLLEYTTGEIGVLTRIAKEIILSLFRPQSDSYEKIESITLDKESLMYMEFFSPTNNFQHDLNKLIQCSRFSGVVNQENVAEALLDPKDLPHFVTYQSSILVEYYSEEPDELTLSHIEAVIEENNLIMLLIDEKPLILEEKKKNGEDQYTIVLKYNTGEVGVLTRIGQRTITSHLFFPHENGYKEINSPYETTQISSGMVEV